MQRLSLLDERQEVWVYSEEDLLIIDEREIILVPKFIVSPMSDYTASKYNWHFIIEQERNFHLRRRSALVKYKKLRNGKDKYWLPKKDVYNKIREDIQSGQYKSTKEYIREYTQRYPELFNEFLNQSCNNIKTLSNQEILKVISDIDVEEIIDNLINRLAHIPTGRADATAYHHFVKSLLEIIFYPHLVNPIIEQEIHEGRKRIDIVMENIAKQGFFHKLHDISRIFCPYIFIECKNYGKDVSNPEIDQLSGRFGSSRGQFGLLLCRAFENEQTFLQRCRDTYKDNRGLIIYLTDEDVINCLYAIKDEDYNLVEQILDDRKRKIMV